MVVLDGWYRTWPVLAPLRSLLWPVKCVDAFIDSDDAICALILALALPFWAEIRHQYMEQPMRNQGLVASYKKHAFDDAGGFSWCRTSCF